MGAKEAIKVILAGVGGIGKSSVLYRYIKKAFMADYQMTIGADFKSTTINLENKEMNFIIWDLAGQDQFRFLFHSYFKGALGVLYFYDLTNAFSTLQNLKEFIELNKNFNNFYKSNKCVQFLIGNKLDCIEGGVKNVDNGPLEYFLKENLDYKFQRTYMTSAKTGENIGSIFTDLGREILKLRYQENTNSQSP